MGVSHKHMDLLTRDNLDLLLTHGAHPCISIFMPTHRMGAETQQDVIRLKNMLREAEQKLIDHDYDDATIERVLAPAYELRHDRAYWQHQCDGLALFLSPEVFLTWRLPVAFKELVFVNQRFYTKPLLPTLSGDGRFHLLAIAKGKVRLFHGTRFTMNEVPLKGIESSFPEALQVFDFERQLQHRPGGAGGNAIYHGHGSSTDATEHKELLRNYLKHLDSAVRRMLGGDHSPLVIAGLNYITGMYREVSHHPRVMDDSIDTTPEALTDGEMHQRAWGIVGPVLERDRNRAMERFARYAGGGDKRADTDLRNIVPAAYFSRVETLFVPLGLREWGAFDPASSEVFLHPGLQKDSEDLLDFAAACTIKNGGTVFALPPEDMPAGTHIAAISRA